MSKDCNNNVWVSDGFALLFQIVLVFVFLTIFFFIYVVNVEKAEFEEEMNYIVDNILTEKIEKELLGPIESLPRTQIVSLVAGIIDGVEYQASMDTKSGVKIVEKQNVSVRTSAFKTLGIVLGVLIIITIIALVMGYCISIRHYTIEALWVVFFVAITEFAFLQIVAKNYKTADPNKVKRVLGMSITKWIKDNKKL